MQSVSDQNRLQEFAGLDAVSPLMFARADSMTQMNNHRLTTSPLGVCTCSLAQTETEWFAW